MLEKSEFKEKLNELGDFWERIEFPNGVVVGPGRNKELLWKKYLSKHISKESLSGKKVLDLGCNAGGNLIEIAKACPSRLVGVEGNEKFYNQAKFVVKTFSIDAEVLHYRISSDTPPEKYAKDLGKFDVIFYLGVLYHLTRRANLNILRYIRQNSQRSFFSSQLFMSEARSNVDWELTEDGHRKLFEEAGFSEIITIHKKTESENWSALTNQWYFEAK
ncbi:DUF1698 domain-containing protein [Shinella sp. BYT-45]|uniref:DUF1698 domain-containing protein n=1 Tax=Shinella sp. BYT-45 TaxID=3377377 RepID=UPI0039816EEE